MERLLSEAAGAAAALPPQVAAAVDSAKGMAANVVAAMPKDVCTASGADA